MILVKKTITCLCGKFTIEFSNPNVVSFRCWLCPPEIHSPGKPSSGLKIAS